MSPSGRSLWPQRPLREAAGRSLLDGEGRARWAPPEPPLQPQRPPSWGWNQEMAPRGFCGQWAPGAPAPLPPALPLSQAPPEAPLRPPSPQSHSPPACTWDTLAAWAALAHHIHTRQPRLQPSTRTASGPQCPPILAACQGALKPAGLRAHPLLWVTTQQAERMPRSPVRWWWTREEGKGECRCGHLL